MGSFAGVAPEFSEAQGTDHAVVTGTVTDATGAVIRGAATHLTLPDGEPAPGEGERDTDGFGEFSFSAGAGEYILVVEAPGFAVFRSDLLTLKPNGRLRVPVRLTIASLHEQVDIQSDEANGSSDPNDLAGAVVFQGETLNLLSEDNATLRQQLNALAGGFGTPNFLIDGFSGGKLPPKSSIRSIRINNNYYSAEFADLGYGRVEISTKPGEDKLHGYLTLSGTDQPWDARNPYTLVQTPFYDFQQEGNLNGPLNRKTSFFFAENTESLDNSAVVNAADPQSPSATLSTSVAAPQRTETYSLRADRQFSPTNFAYVRDEWSQTHIANSGITPLVLPVAAFTLNTMTNAFQLADTQTLGAHAVNETRFQYLRTRVRRDPNSTLPSILVQGSFQDGGNPLQALQDNQDAYEAQDLLEFDRGHHSIRTGFRFRALRDANQSTEGFNGQYIFPDAASFLAGHPTQFSQTVGQAGAVLTTNDLAVYAEDDWKIRPGLTFSYGLRFESQSAIPDHADPAPRIGFAWAVRPGKRKSPLVTLRGGYGLFYDRFPAAQLLQAVRQNGTREVAYLVKDPAFNPTGPPPGLTLPASQPTVYQVDPHLRTVYGQAGSISVIRSLGRLGSVSGNLFYAHQAHGYLTRNINAPLPGTFDPDNPASGTRPLGTAANVYQFSSAANGNAEHFFLKYNLRLNKRLFGFGVADTQKNYTESDGIASFPSNGYNLRQDYGRAAISRAVSYTGGFTLTLPLDVQLTPFLLAHSGAPFDITTGSDRNGDTIYNDRPGIAADPSRASVVNTSLGSFDTAPQPGETLIPRNFGTSPAYVWLQLRATKDLRVGPRPAMPATGPDGKPAPRPDRPWDLNFGVEVHNLTNHNNPGLPVGVLSAQPCGTASAVPCNCGVGTGQCALAPSQFFGHSLSLASDFSPITASNRTILLQTTFTF